MVEASYGTVNSSMGLYIGYMTEDSTSLSPTICQEGLIPRGLIGPRELLNS